MNWIQTIFIKEVNRWLLAMAVMILSLTGCKKFIEVPLPGTETFPENIYDSDLTATSALIAIYAEMVGNDQRGFASGGPRSLCNLPSLSADELESYAHLDLLREFYLSEITPANQANEKGLWTEAYRYIYAANAILEGLQASSGVSPATRTQLEGEAYFIRAFVYFYLVNLYGKVPLALTTDYRVNGNLSRSPVDMVYDQITSDLQQAINQLAENYPTVEKIRPNLYTAKALQARVFLYRGHWQGAYDAATEVIASGRYGLDSLDGVFLKSSREAIWQLRPNTAGLNTWQARNFILTALPGTGEMGSSTLSQQLLDDFEAGDGRRSHWVDSVEISGRWYHFPYKYKIHVGDELKEYCVVLRLAELYLIRAEAHVRLGNLAAAKADLDSIRLRAGLSPTGGHTTAALLEAILQERRRELFTEYGHRWLDLKRTKRADAVLRPLKGAGWLPSDTLYPIPQKETTINPNLDQNAGY